MVGSRLRLLQRPPAGDNPEQNHYDGNDEEHVNKPVYRGAGYQAHRPQDEQHYRECV